MQNLSATITPGVIVTPNAMVQGLKTKVRCPLEKGCIPPNLVAAQGHYSGADPPLAEEGTSASTSFGETSSAIQLQLGPLSTDTGLSTVVQSVQDVNRRERTGGETSPVASRERACERDMDHVPSDYIM